MPTSPSTPMTLPEPNYSKGVMAKYARQVSQADDGAVTGA